jgi:hypothetical protein
LTARSLIVAASALIGCASNPRQVRFSDGSVLTAKECTGDSFKEVRYVQRNGSVLTADSATLLKERVVFTNAVASINGHQVRGDQVTMTEYMTVVQHR